VQTIVTKGKRPDSSIAVAFGVPLLYTIQFLEKEKGKRKKEKGRLSLLMLARTFLQNHNLIKA